METRDFQHNGKLYRMLVPGVLVSMPLCNRVATMLGPVVTTLGAEAKVSGGLAAFGNALKAVDPVALQTLFMDVVMAAKLECDRRPISTVVDFEQHFGQCRADVYPVCMWCVWECVRDFFPQLGAFAQVAKAAAEKAFQSPPGGASTGG